MNILSYFFNSNIINSHFSDFSNLHESLSFPLNLSFDIRNYSNYIAALASASKSLILSLLVSHLKAIDLSFRNSNTRKSRYYVKVTCSRTFITPFGIIAYTRTIYSFKDSSNGTYCHLDSLLGIPKYNRYQVKHNLFIIKKLITSISCTSKIDIRDVCITIDITQLNQYHFFKIEKNDKTKR